MQTLTYECNAQWEQFVVQHGTDAHALRLDPGGKISYYVNGKLVQENMVDETGYATPAERAFRRGSGYTWKQVRRAYNKANPNSPAP